MSECNSVNLDNLNKICDLMKKQYNLGIEAQLDRHEIETLDSISVSLANYCKKQAIEFDVDGFKRLAKKLYPKKLTQFGGDETDALVVRENENVRQQKNKGFNSVDFLAILAFLGSIVLCYIAYIKINEITIATTGADMGDVFEKLSDDMKTAINDVKNLPSNDLTFIQFIYRSITTFSCSVVDSQISNIQSFTIEVIESSFKNARENIINAGVRHCGLQTQVLSDDWGFLGQIINQASSIVTEVASPGSTANCLSEITKSQLEKLINDQKYAIEVITTELRTKSNQISGLLIASGRLGVGSVSYFIFRLKDIRMPGVKIPTLKQIPDYEDLPRIYNRGGKKSKKHRKSNKKLKKSKKNKTKKYKKHYK